MNLLERFKTRVKAIEEPVAEEKPKKPRGLAAVSPEVRRQSGLKAAETNKKSDPDFYKKIGKKGGLAKHTKPRGFATFSPEKRSECGKKGGSMSRRDSRGRRTTKD